MRNHYTLYQWRIWIQRNRNQLYWLPWCFTYLLTLCSSSSLDALDADSEGEGPVEQAHLCYTPVSQSSSRTGIPSGDELDSFETNTEPDFNISRTESLSLSSNLQSKVFWLVLMWLILSGENVLSESIHLWKTNDVLFTCINFCFWRPHALADWACLFHLSHSNLYGPYLQGTICFHQFNTSTYNLSHTWNILPLYIIIPTIIS